MYDYVEGYCPVTHYRCLMPIEYEKKEDKQFHKTKVACAHLSECKDIDRCEHFQNALETQEKWKLRETKMG